MMIPKAPKWIAFLMKNVRKIGMVFSFLITTYKAFQYRGLYIDAEKEKSDLHKRLDGSNEEVKQLTETYNNVLLKLSLDSYQINDIALPFWYKIYDPFTGDFKMVRFNKSYEEKYGSNPNLYFGKPDPLVIGEIGEEYQGNDKKAYESGKIEIFYERYIDKDDGLIKIGKYAKWRIDKPSGSYLFGLELEP